MAKDAARDAHGPPGWLDHETATDAEIAAYCSTDAALETALFKVQGGHRVIQLSDTAVVKIGYGLREQEAKNQQIARTLLDPSVVQVPQVYRFFQYNDLGYLVMEYIVGVPSHTIDVSVRERRIKTVLAHLASITHTVAGPLAGGRAEGILWSERGNFSPTSLDDISEYINIRIKARSRKIDLSGEQLVLVHGDIGDRNFVWQADGRAHLIDWASAGFYPRVFEICAMRLTNEMFTHHLVASIMLNELEEALAYNIILAYNREQHCYFGPRIRLPKIQKVQAEAHAG